MKRIVRLTESDLVKLVKRVIKEQRIFDDPMSSTTPLPIQVKNIKSQLEELGFKYKPEGSNYKFEYEVGENFILVSVNPINKTKPYSVRSIIEKQNYKPHPSTDGNSKFNSTYTDMDKQYLENDYNLLISDVKKSKNKIITKVK
jgi:predicted RNA binding protein YcfA (HicA-like mRNA interferase family)